MNRACAVRACSEPLLGRNGADAGFSLPPEGEY